MGISGQPSNQATSMIQAHTGQQLHVSGVFIVLLEIALVVENLLPTLVVAVWLPAPAREVNDRLVAAFSVTCILSALVPTPLGLASYFSGGWYGGVPTCTTYQVTSMWCNLSSLAILTCICVNSFLAVWSLMKVKSSARHQPNRRTLCPSVCSQHPEDSSYSSHLLPSQTLTDTKDLSTAQKLTDTKDLFTTQKLTDTKDLFTAQKLTDTKDLFTTQKLTDNKDLFTAQKLTDTKDLLTTQNNQFSSVEPGSSSSGFVNCSSPRKGANCQVTPNLPTGCDNTIDTNTAVVSGNVNCDNVVFQPQFPSQESADNSVAADNPAQSTSQCYDSLTSSIHRVSQETSGHENEKSSPYKNGVQEPGSAIYKRSESRAVNNGSSDADTEIATNCDLSSLQPCQVTTVFESKNEEYSGTTRSMTYSQVKPAGIAEKLETDLNQILICESTSSYRRGWFCVPTCQSRDFVLVTLFLMFASTLAISSLPLTGFGPQTIHSETSCRSWLVPIPLLSRERTFYVVYLFFVYTCLVLGCGSGVIVCLTVSRRMKQERKRKSRLYHEEDNVPDVAELFALDDLKRHYSLTCVVVAGLLTWLPIATMLSLQKLGVQVSEATLMYSNIATSLPGLLNPLLYSLALAKYRTGYKVIMDRCCCKGGARKSHCLTEVQTNPGTSDGVTGTDTALSTTSEGHTCLHGRVNPNFDSSHVDVSVDETDEENDEDYFPDDSELAEDDIKQQVTLSEKTPLQGLLASAPSAGALRTVFTNRSKSSWQRQQDKPFSSCSDSECLLDPRTTFTDEETGL